MRALALVMPMFSPLGLAAQDPRALVLLALAGAFAATVNAAAGGGSLISFPTMVALGMPPLAANATNSAALSLGNLASAVGLLPSLGNKARLITRLLIPTLAGAALGAWLLTVTTERTFRFVVPALLFVATSLLAGQDRIRRRQARSRPLPALAGAFLQFAVSVYGGYFGAGMGILMLAVLGLSEASSLNQLNAVKNWLSVAINLIAAALLIARGLVWLWPAVALAAGSITGGYSAALLLGRIRPETLRRIIVLLGAVMTAYFTWHAFRA